MPELPEVETTVRGIKKVAVGKKITDVWTDYNSPHYASSDQIKNPRYFADFKKLIVGKKIVGASRRAKNVLIHLEKDLTILIHMKMTGHVMYGKYSYEPKVGEKDPWKPQEVGPLQDPFNKFIHLVFSLSDKKQLVLSDMRKFAKVTLLKTSELENHEGSHLKDIGPEPLSPQFTYPVFKERISKRSTGKIKTVLMDQSLIAGIGNIYSDEVLWRAGVHPEEQVKNIPDVKLKVMHAAVKETLKKGIDFGGDSMSDYRNIYGQRGKFQEAHQAYRRTKKPCNKKGCGGTIVRKVVATRSAHFCDTHQNLIKQ